MFKKVFLEHWIDWTIAIIIMVFIVVWGAVRQFSMEQDFNIMGRDVQYTTKSQTTIPLNWKTYRNEKYHFQFSYPEAGKLHTSSTGFSVEFEKENSFYNIATVSFVVYKKDTFKLPPRQPVGGQCGLYALSTKTISGKTAQLLEENNCTGNEEMGTNSLFAIISLGEGEDLVFMANLGNSFIRKNDYGNKILDTLNFF